MILQDLASVCSSTDRGRGGGFYSNVTTGKVNRRVPREHWARPVLHLLISDSNFTIYFFFTEFCFLLFVSLKQLTSHHLKHL